MHRYTLTNNSFQRYRHVLLFDIGIVTNNALSIEASLLSLTQMAKVWCDPSHVIRGCSRPLDINPTEPKLVVTYSLEVYSKLILSWALEFFATYSSSLCSFLWWLGCPNQHAINTFNNTIKKGSTNVLETTWDFLLLIMACWELKLKIFTVIEIINNSPHTCINGEMTDPMTKHDCGT